MGDAREFRMRSQTFVKALLMTRENMIEVQRLAPQSHVELLYRKYNSPFPNAFRYYDAEDTRHEALPGCMAVITGEGWLTTMAENEFLRMFEPHGYIDWTEPRLDKAKCRHDADAMVQRMRVDDDFPGYRIQVNYGEIINLLAQLLRDVRATGSEAENIRIGYGASCAHYSEQLTKAWQDVGAYKDAVRTIRRLVLDFPVTKRSGVEAAERLLAVRRAVRWLKPGRE